MAVKPIEDYYAIVIKTRAKLENSSCYFFLSGVLHVLECVPEAGDDVPRSLRHLRNVILGSFGHWPPKRPNILGLGA